MQICWYWKQWNWKRKCIMRMLSNYQIGWEQEVLDRGPMHFRRFIFHATKWKSNFIQHDDFLRLPNLVWLVIFEHFFKIYFKCLVNVWLSGLLQLRQQRLGSRIATWNTHFYFVLLFSVPLTFFINTIIPIYFVVLAQVLFIFLNETMFTQWWCVFLSKNWWNIQLDSPVYLLFWIHEEDNELCMWVMEKYLLRVRKSNRKLSFVIWKKSCKLLTRCV